MISVIMPIYNVKKYLKTSIESVLNQTFNDFELIIVDDGSTDGSREVLDEYKDNKQIKIYHQSNQGLSAARNTGLKYAQGDIIYFFDSDDIINIHLFEYISERFKNSNLDFISFNYKEFQDGKIINNKFCLNSSKIFDLNRNDALLKLLNGEIYQMAWSYFVKKNIICDNDITFSEGKLFEDNNSAAKIISHINEAEVIVFDEAPYLLRNRKNSITSNAYKNLSLRELNDELYVFKDEYKVFLQSISKKDLRYVHHWYFSKLLHLYIKYHLSLLRKNPDLFTNIKSEAKHIYISNKIVMNKRDRIRWYRINYPIFDKFVRIIRHDRNKFR